MKIEVINLRKGPFGNALAFFDVVLDQTFVVRSFVLKRTKDQSKYYYQAPAKARLDKDGNAVLNEDKFPIYDNYFDLYGEKTSEGYKIVEAGWEGRDAILEQAVAQFDAAPAKGAGRGTAKPKIGTGKAGTVAGTEDAAEEDNLPF